MPTTQEAPTEQLTDEQLRLAIEGAALTSAMEELLRLRDELSTRRDAVWGTAVDELGMSTYQLARIAGGISHSQVVRAAARHRHPTRSSGR